MTIAIKSKINACLHIFVLLSLMMLLVSCQTLYNSEGFKSFNESMFIRKEARIDPRERMELISNGLNKRGVPKPAWQTMVQQTEIDELKDLPDSKGLAGLIGMKMK